MTARQPMAFFHDERDYTWNFAMRYAGSDGHIATLPEIAEACIAASKENPVWNMHFTTNSAEYYGVGADGREKLIIAHGVGPMSTLKGIAKAYSWRRYGNQRCDGSGRISIREFLDLEAGRYGDVSILDAREYLGVWRDNAFGHYSALLGCINPLLTARLGSRLHDYLSVHDEIARWWHENMSIDYPEGGPYIVQCQTATTTNCPHIPYYIDSSCFDWPQIDQNNFAIGCLLTVSGLIHTLYHEGQYLINTIGCHGRSDGTRLIGVPAGETWQTGIDVALQPEEVLRRDWQRLMRPSTDLMHTPPPFYRIEHTDNGEWFTRYSKPIDEESMDYGDIEFHVDLVELIGDAQFQVNDDFFLRYKLSRVVKLAPANTNAYEIINVSNKDKLNLRKIPQHLGIKPVSWIPPKLFLVFSQWSVFNLV